jgi:stage II sporulation protein AA (anti-sigma F factor antagonist)
MQISEAPLDGALVVIPAGRIDTTTAPGLERQLDGLLARGERRVVVDFSGVEYISSAGLRVMLLLAKRLKELRGRLALCGLNDAVRQVFQLAGFLQLFTICDSRETAAGQTRSS